jgi:hypothetical protein
MYYAKCRHLSYICWQCLKKEHLLGSKVQAGNFGKEFNKFCLTVLKKSARSQSMFCPRCCLHNVFNSCNSTL